MRRILRASVLFFVTTALLFLSAMVATAQEKGDAEGQANIHKTRGLALATAGDWEGAIREYDEAIRLNPSHSVAYFDKGIALTRLARLPEAEAAYRESIRIDPSDWRSHYNFAYLL